MTEIAVISADRHIKSTPGSEALKVLGANIKLARKRRNWSENELAQKAEIARSTLQLIEQGRPSVSMGAYFQVLNIMGLGGDLEEVGKRDEPGRQLMDQQLITKKSKP